MNFKIALKLMTIPTLIGSLLLGLFTEGASAINTSNATAASCDAPSMGELRSSRRHGTLVASSASIADETEYDFTEAESDASAALFGCDCGSCINALRQLRNPSLVDSVNGKGHCWTSMQRRVSPEKVQEVLQDLEVKEAK